MSANFSGIRSVLPPVNEPIKSYAPGSPEKASLKARLASMASETIDIPLIIGGKEIRTGDLGKAVMPHKHGHVLATFHHARPKDVTAAIAAAQAAKAEWASWPWEDRAAVFLKAADLLATSWRDTLNAATMLNQSKTVYQSEIDAACELIDFWRYNVAFGADIMREQPVSTAAMWNQTDYRPLEGFIYAVSPFNFTAIGGNLTTTPALMGNTVLWKPAGHGDARRLLHDEAARGGRPAAGRHQLRARRPGDGEPDRGAGLARPRRHPLHRQHGRVPGHVGPRGRQHRRRTSPTRAWSARPAARTSSWCTPPPTRRRSPWRWCAAPTSTRARSARRPAASTCRSRCGRRVRDRAVAT